MARGGKRLKAAYEAVDRNKSYPLAEAAALVKDNAKAKFDETIEISILSLIHISEPTRRS